ncbi:hypothetical protein C5613_13345 [Rhodococcus opacus]|uniref:Uncharacterized protein n=1 Tax=Rhodococcus opacus TaxID=37919 RepID=A0A2S8JBT1_RHOOP|nr:hypothetical protein C5613_13345 [Rhodococcus opacus]
MRAIFARTAPMSPEGYWQPHPSPAVAVGPQHVDFSLRSQQVACRSVLQHVGAAVRGFASVRSIVGFSNLSALLMVAP